jgi:hypothetical protein
MTLAAVLLFSIWCPSSALPAPHPVLPVRHQTAPQAAPSATKPDAAPAQDAPTQDHPSQDQGTAPPAQNPPAPSPPPAPKGTPAQKSSSQAQPSTKPRFHHQRRVLPPNCNPAPAAAGQPASGSTPDSPTPDSSTSGSTSTPPEPAAPKSAPGNCPPTKVIVRQGGISEPSIQLAGGAGGTKNSRERDTANQMLESTKTNLKKIAGHQLTPNQQDMVNQTRQFMDQAKTAVDAGDLERARTLARKAQLLSEELVKPGK